MPGDPMTYYGGADPRALIICGFIVAITIAIAHLRARQDVRRNK